MQIVIDKENLIKMFAITLYAISESSLYDVAKDTVTELVEEIGYTPLPKGHGRLIDAGALLMDFAFANNKSAGECVHDAPTIIDADKECD